MVDFGQLSRLLNIIVSARILDVNFKNLVSGKEEVFQQECRKVMDYLINKCKFKEARLIARESGISMDDVTIAEVRNSSSFIIPNDRWFDFERCRKDGKLFYISKLLLQIHVLPNQFFQNKWEKQKLLVTSLWGDPVTRRKLWMACEDRCTHHKVAPLTVAQYFQVQGLNGRHTSSTVRLVFDK